MIVVAGVWARPRLAPAPNGAESEQRALLASTRQFARAAIDLALPYWQSRERWAARGLLAVIVAMNLGLVYVNVLFSDWNNRFYDALQQHDFPRFIHELE